MQFHRDTAALRQAVVEMTLGFWILCAAGPWVAWLGASLWQHALVATLLAGGVAFRTVTSRVPVRVGSELARILTPLSGLVLVFLPGDITSQVLALFCLPILGWLAAVPVTGIFPVGLGVFLARVWPGPSLPLDYFGVASGVLLVLLARFVTPTVRGELLTGGMLPRGSVVQGVAALLVGGIFLAGWWVFSAVMTPSRMSDGLWWTSVLVVVGLARRWVGGSVAGRIPLQVWPLVGAGGVLLFLLGVPELALGLGLTPLFEGLTEISPTLAVGTVSLLLATVWVGPVAAAAWALAPGSRTAVGALFGVGLLSALYPQRLGEEVLVGLGLLLLAGAARHASWRIRIISLVLALGLLAAPTWNLGVLTAGIYPQLERREGIRRAISDASRREVLSLSRENGENLTVYQGDPPSTTLGGATAVSRLTLQDETFLAHLGFFAVPEKPSVLVVGPGSGVALNVARQRGVRQLDVQVATEAQYQSLAHYRRWNEDIVSDPLVRPHPGALRPYLRGGSWDLILVPAVPLWTRSGVTLLTREGLAGMARALSPGVGRVVVGVPLQPMSPDSLSQIVATFCDVFPGCSAWLSPSATLSLVLVGGTDAAAPTFNYTQMATVGPGNLDSRRSLLDLGITSADQVVERLLAPRGVLRQVGEGRVLLTDGRPGLDISLPAIPFDVAPVHALTLFQGKLGEGTAEISVEEDPSSPSATTVREILTRARESHEAFIGLLASLGAGSYDEAVRAVLKLGPRSDREVSTLVQPYLDRARRDLSQGLYEQATAQLTLATVLAPRQAEPWLLLARAQVSSGKADVAVRSLREALERDPENTQVMLALSDLLQEAGQQGGSRHFVGAGPQPGP